MYGTINRYLNSFSNNQCGLWIFECVNFLVKSNWLLHEMSTLCIGVPKPHTNVPRSFECKSYTFTLSNFKFNLYANTMLKICRFLLCIYRYVRSANEIILLVQLQPLYHPHTHTHSQTETEKDTVTDSHTQSRSLARIPESDYTWQCCCFCELNISSIVWINFMFFCGYKSISTVEAIPFTYSKWKPSIDDFMAPVAFVFVSLISPELAILLSVMVCSSHKLFQCLLSNILFSVHGDFVFDPSFLSTARKK